MAEVSVTEDGKVINVSDEVRGYDKSIWTIQDPLFGKVIIQDSEEHSFDQKVEERALVKRSRVRDSLKLIVKYIKKNPNLFSKKGHYCFIVKHRGDKLKSPLNPYRYYETFKVVAKVNIEEKSKEYLKFISIFSPEQVVGNVLKFYEIFSLAYEDRIEGKYILIKDNNGVVRFNRKKATLESIRENKRRNKEYRNDN